MKPQQILALTAEFPACTGSGGQVRAFHCLEELARHADLTIAVLTPLPDKQQGPQIRARILQTTETDSSRPGISVRNRLAAFAMPWRQYGRRIMLTGQNICSDRSGLPRFSPIHWVYGVVLTVVACLLRIFLRPDPPDLHIRGPAGDRLLELLRSAKPDCGYQIIWAEHSYLYPLAERCQQIFPNSQIIVNAHNIEFQLKRSLAAGRSDWLGRFWLSENSRLYHSIESRMVRMAASVLCCSEADAARLRQLKSGKAAISVVPNGIDTHSFLPSVTPPAHELIVFTGTAGYAPNDDAVRWLLADVFPDVLKACPHAKLLLAGRNAARNWARLAQNHANVEIVCSPLDMRPLLQGALVAIVPLRQGSGTRFKILEAMSTGLPVVSTALGAEGLPVTHGQNILIADTSDELAASVRLLLNNKPLRQKLADAARQLVTEQLDWSGIRYRMIDSLREHKMLFPRS